MKNENNGHEWIDAGYHIKYLIIYWWKVYVDVRVQVVCALLNDDIVYSHVISPKFYSTSHDILKYRIILLYNLAWLSRLIVNLLNFFFPLFLYLYRQFIHAFLYLFWISYIIHALLFIYFFCCRTTIRLTRVRLSFFPPISKCFRNIHISKMIWGREWSKTESLRVVRETTWNRQLPFCFKTARINPNKTPCKYQLNIFFLFTNLIINLVLFLIKYLQR